jgi:hypothetical protein
LAGPLTFSPSARGPRKRRPGPPAAHPHRIPRDPLRPRAHRSCGGFRVRSAVDTCPPHQRCVNGVNGWATRGCAAPSGWLARGGGSPPPKATGQVGVCPGGYDGWVHGLPGPDVSERERSSGGCGAGLGDVSALPPHAMPAPGCEIFFAFPTFIRVRIVS